MKKERLTGFSDGVIAVIITIMVLELKAPHGTTFASLFGLWHVFLAYVLSFVFVGIYWNNHHHLFGTIDSVDGRTMWANLHLLFWLSLVPVATAWRGEHPYEALPAAFFGTLLLFCALAFTFLQQCAIWANGPDSLLARAVGSDLKGKGSALLYLLAIPLAYVDTRISDAIFILIAVAWFLPDRRMERAILDEERASGSPANVD